MFGDLFRAGFALNLPFILLALPGARGEESPSFRDRQIWACVPAQLVMERPMARDFTQLTVGFLICPMRITSPAFRAGGKD